jgi:hypothetical protein
MPPQKMEHRRTHFEPVAVASNHGRNVTDDMTGSALCDKS